MNLILLLFSTLIFTLYIVYIYKTHGILSSISYSFKIIKKPILYILAMWGVAIPMMIVSSTPLTFFAGVGICFAGISAGIAKNKTEEIIHRIGAEGGILLAILAMWIDFNLWYLTIGYILFTMGAIKFKLKNHTWWIEIVAFITVLLGLFIVKI